MPAWGAAGDARVTTYRFDRIEVRPVKRELLIDGQPTLLGARAFDLLLALVERRERVVTKNEILGKTHSWFGPCRHQDEGDRGVYCGGASPPTAARAKVPGGGRCGRSRLTQERFGGRIDHPECN